MKILATTLFLSFLSVCIYAQKPLNPIKDNTPKSRIELIKTDSLVGENAIMNTQTFLGNVIFRHRGVLLGCNKAIHNVSSNLIEAYGKVVINQGDTLTIVGDTLYYDGNTRFARVLGKSVILRDKKVTLRTSKLNYDLNIDQAYYPVYGTINQDSSKLSSNEGFYNTKSKVFKYIGNVEIINPTYVLCTDTLNYDTNTKQAVFNSFTTIKSTNGNLSAYKGRYNIKTKVSKFEGRAMVINAEYSLEADTLNFNNDTDSGLALGNVIFNSFADSIKVVGLKGIRTGQIGQTIIIGETISEKISGIDTVYIAADSLWIIENKSSKLDNNPPKTSQKTISTTSQKTQTIVSEQKAETKKAVEVIKSTIMADSSQNTKLSKRKLKRQKAALENKQNISTVIHVDPPQKDSLTYLLPPPKPESKKRDVHKIIAKSKVNIFRNDFQSVSDSLVYDLKDSVISFFYDPLIWNAGNQLEADSMTLYLKNNKLKHLKMIQNSFVIAMDTINNYNQIKGRNINTFFDDKAILKTIKVEGNGQSLYFALDEKNKIIGLNKVDCSLMQFDFLNKKIKQIAFKGEPESLLIPPKEIVIDDLKLENFEWKTNKKPTRNTIFSKKLAPLLKSKTPQVI